MIKNHIHCLCPRFSVWWESYSASIPPKTSLGEPAKGFKPNLSLGVSYASNPSKKLSLLLGNFGESKKTSIRG